MKEAMLIPNDLINDPTLRPRACRVYMYLGSFAGEALTAQSVIDGLSMSRPTIYAALNDLIDAGWAERVGEGVPGSTVGYRALLERRTYPSENANHSGGINDGLAAPELRGADHEEVVYYLADYSLNICKIGTSRNVARRMTGLSKTSPGANLRLVGWEPGGYDTERIRHGQFKDLRIVGEWFALRGVLTDHVAACRVGDPSAGGVR